jgi:23S rRNA (pseudouridine1915-N3)-methyltransferase
MVTTDTRRYLTANILIVGKKNGAEQFIDDGYAEYEKRLGPTMKINTIFLKSDEALVQAAKDIKGSVIALDENGKQYTSRQFSDVVYKGFEDGGANLSFIIGGFSGLPPEIKSKYPLMSLSKMTWTHQMARLLLIEQIYRAVEIHKGSGYHKD